MTIPLETLLGAIRATYRKHVLDAVQDGLPASYARTINVLLDQACDLAAHQQQALEEEALDLRAVLPSLGSDLNVETADVQAMRKAMVDIIPRLDPRHLSALSAFLLRQQNREASWIPDRTPQKAF